MALKNEKTAVSFSPERESITGHDLTDQYNGTTFFTRNKRGIKKAWAALETAFTPEMSMYDVMRFLDGYRLNTHSYCSVD